MYLCSLTSKWCSGVVVLKTSKCSAAVASPSCAQRGCVTAGCPWQGWWLYRASSGLLRLLREATFRLFSFLFFCSWLRNNGVAFHPFSISRLLWFFSIRWWPLEREWWGCCYGLLYNLFLIAICGFPRIPGWDARVQKDIEEAGIST